MANELEIWVLDGEADATRVKQVARTESELKLEDTLVKNPEMLMPGLTLIGRQTPTKGGPLDLLGHDEDGRLVVFELKRGPLTREAVTQIIDYVSALESMNEEDLVKHITERSKGIRGIEPFDYQTYVQTFPDVPLTPVQMTLVGLGADASATRIVEFLAKRGMRMSMLTFHGYHHDGKVFLAKQVQTERDIAERAKARSSRNRKEEERALKKALDERIDELKIRDFWEDVFGAFEDSFLGTPYVLTNGFNMYIPSTLNLPNHPKGFNVPLSILLTREPKIRIAFFPVSVHLCRQEFENSKLGFEKEQTKTQTTNEIQHKWFLELGDVEWKEHKEELVALADAVKAAWREARRKSRG